MTQVKYTGKILLKDKIKYQSVEGYYEIFKEPTGLKNVEGKIKILSGESPGTISGELIMDDGNAMDITITNVNVIERTGLFTGSGVTRPAKPDRIK